MVLGNVLTQVFGYQGPRWDLSYGYCPLLRGSADTCGGVGDWASHLILPWATFALLYLALWIWGMIAAFTGRVVKFPLIGAIAQHWAGGPVVPVFPYAPPPPPPPPAPRPY